MNKRDRWINLIVVVFDSFRQDHVSYYNKGRRIFANVPSCSTPNLDKFAKESIVFHNAYPAGLPTIPARTELMTGHFTLPYRPWGPLYPSEITMAEIFKREGFTTGLIADTFHLFKPGMNFHKGFDSFNWIRGQEYDPYNSAPPVRKKLEKYINRFYFDSFAKRYDTEWGRLVQMVLSNTDNFEKEEDWFPAKVFDAASKWVEKNMVHEKFLLWVDNFDPHEPWDPIERFDTYTNKDYAGPRLILPLGGFAKSWATEEEIDYIRGLYAGEASFVDHCFGSFYRKLRELGLLDNSIVVVLSDHGHPLADHGKFLKGGDRMYSELLKVPFFVRLPGGEKARETDAIVQFPDLLPTMLELFGLGNNISSMHGKSFLPVLLEASDEHRRYSITGVNDAVDRCVRDTKWSYVQRPEGQLSELYNLETDPRETHNLINDKPDEAKRLREAFGSYFQNYQSRLIRGVQGRHELSGTAFG